MFSLLSDRRIIEYCTANPPMISPFVAESIKKIDFLRFDDQDVPYQATAKAISYGTSSYGYDIRLAEHDFRIFKKPNIWQRLGLQQMPVIDPKNFDESFLCQSELLNDNHGKYFIMPPHSAALGVSVEYFKIPRRVTGIAVGKSTYARSAITPFVTPLEAGWEGHLTLEFGNNTDFPCRVYANEGVLQLVFFEGDDCITSYGDRNGKYQNQSHQVTLPKV